MPRVTCARGALHVTPCHRFDARRDACYWNQLARGLHPRACNPPPWELCDECHEPIASVVNGTTIFDSYALTYWDGHQKRIYRGQYHERCCDRASKRLDAARLRGVLDSEVCDTSPPWFACSP